MIITYIDDSGTEAAQALAASLGYGFTDLKAYIEHKIGLDSAQIRAEGDEHWRAVEAEAVRDVIMMKEVCPGDLVFRIFTSTYASPVLRILIDGKTEVRPAR